ncbi:hypothetical protein [Methylococcus sp. EFPC2]|uniref:hypothetical protein n=1 Tax=Methylococcus sp. EFPC2 TaxID=2812648 RepID=UPI001967EA09|nr:hypothetical protein [Methylococcus sp. EFPC2]QSA96775.1 hypothetical protein JWZ97_16440 [Methylococcus sp. EFPC2]
MTSPPPTAIRRALAALLAGAFLYACSPQRDKLAPLPLPSSQNDHVDVQGALISASPYIDPRQAEAAFGFDIRGAGLLPVRFALDNRSNTVIRINPQQTFLIDLDGQAWPVLSTEQAYNRVARAQELGTVALGSAQGAGLLGAAGLATGFAISVVTGHLSGTPLAQGAAAGVLLGALTGGSDANYELENQVREDLARKSLRNQLVQPGELAHGVLFFPGQDEARTARGLRLSLDLDGYPQIVTLPLKVPPPLPAKP